MHRSGGGQRFLNQGQLPPPGDAGRYADKDTAMTAFPGDASFEHINPSIFRIESIWSTGDASATAFVVAMLANSRKLILATAKHVLDVPEDQDVHWKIQ